ncbi:MAG: Capsular exopolysaccharide family [uncultured Thiotrichaceae bacterium]|uniref:non-specific protein-tyrosine kinase n=1 Tax=uncultured Thiotrichaceae bacterium TaxID=298394 RepID=A0A6S6TJZ7_9GAMM|nr:MAG: Capsular exopolysaccharide family [uncultured Thiotrichaceae bacterium]
MQNLNHTAPGNLQDRPHIPEFAKAQDSLDLRGFWKTLSRQKGTILSIIGIVLLLTLVFTLFSSPLYRATATLNVERETNKVIDVEFLNQGDIRDTRDFYQTQFELIRRYSNIERVVEKLNLNSDIIRRSMLARIKGLIVSPGATTEKAALVQAISDNLYIEPIKNSRLVNVHFEGSSPEKSAAVANAIVESFVAANAELQVSATTNAEKLLNEGITAARSKLEESEKKLSDYAQEHTIVQLDNKSSTTSTYKIVQLSDQLGQAQREIIAIKTDPERSGELAAAQESAELIRDELNREEERALKRQNLNNTYKTLEREVETDQAAYQGLLQRLKEINVAGSVATNNLRVVDKAQPPLDKHKPNMMTNMAFASLLGLLLGIAVAFLRDFMDDSVKDINELERQTQLPILGIIPAVREKDPRKMAQLALTEPRSTVAESFRTLRTTLRFKLREANGDNTLFITSSRANEGKTTVSINLASTYAHAGNKVLLIDADLRNPSLHKVMGTTEENGLTSYLTGESTLDKLAQTSNVQNLDIIPAGKTSHDPAELLSNRRMQDLLQIATENYDMVIIDGPPILGLADAMILSSMTTLTVLAVDSGNTRTTTVTNALKRLRQSGLTVSGILLNQVSDASDLGYEDDYYSYPTRV